MTSLKFSLMAYLKAVVLQLMSLIVVAGHLNTTSYEKFYARASKSMEESDIAHLPGFRFPDALEGAPVFPDKNSPENKDMLPGFLLAVTKALDLEGMVL